MTSNLELGDGPLESHEQGISNVSHLRPPPEVAEFNCEVRKVGVWTLVFVWISGGHWLPIYKDQISPKIQSGREKQQVFYFYPPDPGGHLRRCDGPTPGHTPGFARALVARGSGHPGHRHAKCDPTPGSLGISHELPALFQSRRHQRSGSWRELFLRRTL